MGSEKLFVPGVGDKDHRLLRMTLVGFCVVFFFFRFWFKPYMNRDVASPPPPSGLRSLLAVCVPLMHSHSLACSCKTSRDLSKFPPLQTFRLILCVLFFCLFFLLMFSLSFLVTRIHFCGASVRHAPCSQRTREYTNGLRNHDSISHRTIVILFDFPFLARSLGAGYTVCDFNINLSTRSAELDIRWAFIRSSMIHDESERMTDDDTM